MNPLRKSHYFYVCSCKKKVFLLDSKLLVHKVNHMSPRWGLDEGVYRSAINMSPLWGLGVAITCLCYTHIVPLGLGGSMVFQWVTIWSYRFLILLSVFVF